MLNEMLTVAPHTLPPPLLLHCWFQSWLQLRNNVLKSKNSTQQLAELRPPTPQPRSSERCRTFINKNGFSLGVAEPPLLTFKEKRKPYHRGPSLKRFMALWLRRLDCKHYGGCPQWQRASGVELGCKESADSQANAETVGEFVPLPVGIECVRCESSDCVSALYDVCPLAALGRAVAMCSLSRSDLTRKHGRESRLDPQIQAGAYTQRDECQ